MEPGNRQTWLAAIHAATHAIKLARAEIRGLQWQLSILKRDYDNSRYACVELLHHFDAWFRGTSGSRRSRRRPGPTAAGTPGATCPRDRPT